MSEQENTTSATKKTTNKTKTGECGVTPFITLKDNAGDQLIVSMNDVYLYGSNLINKYTNSTIMHVGLEDIESVRSKFKV